MEIAFFFFKLLVMMTVNMAG